MMVNIRRRPRIVITICFANVQIKIDNQGTVWESSVLEDGHVQVRLDLHERKGIHTIGLTQRLPRDFPLKSW